MIRTYETESVFKKIIDSKFAIPGAVVAFVFIFIYSSLSIYADKPGSSDNTKKTIIVKPGQHFNEIVHKLYENNIISNTSKFKLLAGITGYDKSIRTGEYLFSANMTPLQILKMLETGKVRLIKITIPEGYSIKQIAELVKNIGFCSKESFIQAAMDPIVAQKKIFPEAKTFEGYLFPETYFFAKNASAKKIIATMLARFKEMFSDKLKQRAVQIGFTIHQVVTLASIIEKETGAAHERPIISSVFHNRLKKNMRLETDPTVIYGIKNFDGDITRKHLTTYTPYNTYKIKGLPPGPIANPGIESLKAALYPDTTDYLYFVSKKKRDPQILNKSKGT